MPNDVQKRQRKASDDNMPYDVKIENDEKKREQLPNKIKKSKHCWKGKKNKKEKEENDN